MSNIQIIKKIPLLFLFVAMLTSYSSFLSAETVKILIQGDTQRIMDSNNGEQDNFVPFMAKVLTDPVTRDADFILQMGDIVESEKVDNSDRPAQYAVAREGWRQLDGKIPYVLNLGNNDAADEYFAAFNDLDPPLYSHNNGKNFAYVFNAGNIDWLVISLRFGSKAPEHKWMEDLIAAHPDKKVILIKHEIKVDSVVMVNRLKKYSNVVLVLSGHTQSQEELLVGYNGNKIGWVRTCHHNPYLDSYFRVLLINTVQGTISSSFYSPQYEKYWHDPTAPYHDCYRSTPWTFEGFDFGTEKLSSAPEGNKAEFISLENIPCCVNPNENFQAIAVVENTGTTEWDADLQQNKYTLGSENPKDNQTWGPATSRPPVSEDVMPGERHRFEVNCTAPSQEGFYNFQLRMLKEGVQWFGKSSENRVVHVAHNKVASSSFENGTNRSKVWSLGSRASWTNENKLSGNSSLQIDGVSTATTQTVELRKNTNYNISLWFNNRDATEGHIVLAARNFSNAAKKGIFFVKPGKNANEWKYFTGSFNTGEQELITFEISSKKLNGTVYFDDVVIRSMAPEESHFAYQGVEYSYAVDAIDFDNDSLEYGYYNRPGWLNFDSEKGILSGTPGNKDIGIHAVTLFAKDTEKEKVFSFSIRVMKAPPLVRWNEIYEIGDGTEEDRDKDGLVDFLEFALGGDPNENDSVGRLPMLLPKDSDFDFTFRRNQSTLTYTVKESVDLVGWSDFTIIDNSHGLVGDTCAVRIPASGEKRFFKLEVGQ